MTVEAPSNGGRKASSTPPARTPMQTLGWMLLYVVLLTPPASWVTLWVGTYLEGLLQPRHWILVQHSSVVMVMSLANFITMWPLYFFAKTAQSSTTNFAMDWRIFDSSVGARGDNL
jgi:hypothetical protein